MSISYIRKAYACTHKVGDAVQIRRGAGTWFDGLSGKILRARAQYLVIKGETWRGNFHPNDVLPLPTKAAL